MKIDYDVLKLDEKAEIARIAEKLRTTVAQTLKRRGLVVAISGGIDSSCCLGLAVQALGPEKVVALVMPEQDSSDFSGRRANVLAKHLGVEVVTQNIAPTLEAIGCYKWRTTRFVAYCRSMGRDGR